MSQVTAGPLPLCARVAAFGESMLRLSTRARLDRAQRLDLHVAGSESNVAVALAQLGWDAAWFSALPDTPPGRRVATDLAGCGVDVSHVRWVEEGRVGVFFVEFAEPPRSTTVWYDRAGSVAAALRPDDLDVGVLDGAGYAVVSGITAGISASARALAIRFAHEARARGARVCVDVNYRPRLWSEEQAAPAIAELVASADIVVCSARDAGRLWSIHGEPREAVLQLREAYAQGAEVVVLTAGADGAVASVSGGEVLEQAACPATVVDPIGAGDAFLAGLLWGLETRDISGALHAGVVAAALKSTLHGDHLLTTPQEFQQQLDDRRHQVLVR